MRYLCNLNIYITVEAATLIGLTFVAATSYVYRSVMAAKKKKGGVRKPTDPTTSAGDAVAAPKGADARGPAGAAPPAKEGDGRPETSPYGSPSCTIPFANPLTMPLDILTRKCPKLHAAYESRHPELAAIPDGVGHVLVHYLHTGTYQSLKPKPGSLVSKQTSELRTSIQVYAAARAYDLPDLMRLAEAKIGRFGKGLPLPTLLEVARDAYPTLNEGDDWFLDYLRSRIRPHLKDPKLLLGSNLLDQISSILSPNRVLLRTVLELFCERIAVHPEPVASSGAAPPAPSTIASPITSPGSSRPVTPLPPAPSMPMPDMRPRSTLREDFGPVRRNSRATPWPSPDNMSEASWSRPRSPEPATIPETVPPRFEAKPMPEPAPARTIAPLLLPELGPVIMDVVPPPGPSVESKTPTLPKVEPAAEPEVKTEVEPESKAATEPEVEIVAEPEAKTEVEPEVKTEVEPEAKTEVEPEVKTEAEPEVNVVAEPEIKTEAEPEVKVVAEPEIKTEAEPEAKVVAEPEIKTDAEPEVKIVAEPEITPEAEPEVKIVAEPEVKIEVEPQVKTEAEPEIETEAETQQTEAVEMSAEPSNAPAVLETTATAELEPVPNQDVEVVPVPLTMGQRERKDSGKGIDLDPTPKELESIPEHVPELETGSKPQLQFRPGVLREADSGFWEGPEVEPAKEPTSSVVELEPVVVPGPEHVHELEGLASPKNEPGVDTRDFANPDAHVKSTGDDKQAEAVGDGPSDSFAIASKDEPVSDQAVEVSAKDDLEAPKLEAEPLQSASTEQAHGKVADSATTLVVPETTPVEEVPEEAKSKESEAKPETEKALQENTEPKDVAEPEPEPEPQAEASNTVNVSDDAQPAGSLEPKTAQPSVEPESKPAGEPEVLAGADTDSAAHAVDTVDAAQSSAVLGAEPAPEQDGAKPEADPAGVQPCSAQVRQRSWKKRFLSLRYPVLFGRGM